MVEFKRKMYVCYENWLGVLKVVLIDYVFMYSMIDCFLEFRLYSLRELVFMYFLLE